MCSQLLLLIAPAMYVGLSWTKKISSWLADVKTDFCLEYEHKA